MTGARVGLGFDVHPFSDDPGRALVLGGVVLDGERGLAGHSDADVVAHAVADALLGAAGLGDIGAHFPDTDSRWQGRRQPDAAGRGGRPGAGGGLVDRQRRLPGGAGGAPPGAPPGGHGGPAVGVVGAPVTVKAKRAEGLGALGRGEGVACFAVALLFR